MPLCVGGGIRTLDDIRDLLLAGCDKVSINTAAALNPQFVSQAARRFGCQCIVVNIDPKRVVKEGREVWEVHTHGGRRGTGLEAVAWAREVERLGRANVPQLSERASEREAELRHDASKLSRGPAPRRARPRSLPGPGCRCPRGA